MGRVELSSFSSGFLLAKNLLFFIKKKNLESAQGVKAPLRSASKDGSFSIPAVFSHQCQGQFLPWCSGMSIPVLFPTWERRLFLLAEPVSCFQSQLPPVSTITLSCSTSCFP